MRLRNAATLLLAILMGSLWWMAAQETTHQAPPDVVAATQQSQTSPEHSQPAAMKRPEQEKTEHDRSSIFLAPNAKPSSPVFKGQPRKARTPDSTSTVTR